MHLSVTDSNILWNKALKKVESSINNKRLYDTFFKDTFIFSCENNVLSIECPSQFVKTYLESRYTDLLSSIASEVANEQIKVKFTYGSVKDGDIGGPNKAILQPNAYVEKSPYFVNSHLDENFTFDNYVVGPTNEEATKAAQVVSANPGKLYNPLFIYSQSGLGKTHLLNAIGNNAIKLNPNTKVLSCSSQEFIDEYIRYVNGERTEDNLKDYIVSFDFFLIDDVQLLQDKTKTEEFFFSVFEILIRNNKQIVLTCDRLPSELNGLDKRLVTRFLRGLTVSIKTPTPELCENIIRRKITLLDNVTATFDEEVIQFIARKFKNSIRDIEGALNRINFYFSLYPVDVIDMTYASEALSILINTKQKKSSISIQKIINSVSSYYSISPAQLTGKIRTGNVVYARHIAIYLIRDLLDPSLKEIGEYFGGRDHSTILHSISSVEEMLKKDKEFEQVINKLKAQITSN